MSSSVARLTADAETAIRARLAAGDESARGEMIERTVGLARWVASRPRVPMHLFDDAAQEGRLAIVQAAQRFDPDTSTPFRIVALVVAERAVWDLIRRESPLHIPAWYTRRLSTVLHVAATLAGRLGREPSEAEIAEAAGISVRAVAQTFERAASLSVVHLDDLDPEEQRAILRKVAAPGPTPAEDAEREDAARWVREQVARLPSRSRGVLVAYYGLDGQAPRGGGALARELGITRQGVAFRLAKAERRLRALAEVAGLQPARR
ncbi:MAG: sigma-70 family RNA polymerase sigma factor [Acidobacteriia bacterium]|nr:sigma-70 family RNA polymerase sigma factor [Terriglobia bacterium]